MKKQIVAVLAGLVLVAGQAAAAGASGGGVQVNDRLGAQGDSGSSQLTGMPIGALLGLAGIVAIISIGIYQTDHQPKSISA